MIRRPLPRLTIVVLAAGFSTRLGQPKPLARIHGRSLLRRTLDVLAVVTSQSAVVVAPPRAARLRAEVRGSHVRLLYNRGRTGGLSTSVVLALRHLPYGGAILFLPVDLAALSARDLARLIKRWRGHRDRVVARGVRGRALTPLILPACLHRPARQLCGDVGLRDFIAALPAEKRVLIDLPSAAFDVDTPQDLTAARRRYGRAGARAGY